MKKKFLVLFSVLCFSVGCLAACSNANNTSTESVPDFIAEYEAEVAAIKEAAAIAAAITPTPKPTATPTPTPRPGKFSSVVGPVDVTCDFTDFTYLSSYGTKQAINTDHSVSLQYKGSYQEVKYRLPESLDLTYCTGITVNMKNEEDTLAIKLLDESLKQAFVHFEGASAGVKDVGLVLELPSTTISSIAFMGPEKAADYSDFATVYSVTFHFSEGFDGSVHAKHVK